MMMMMMCQKRNLEEEDKWQNSGEKEVHDQEFEYSVVYVGEKKYERVLKK